MMTELLTVTRRQHTLSYIELNSFAVSDLDKVVRNFGTGAQLN